MPTFGEVRQWKAAEVGSGADGWRDSLRYLTRVAEHLETEGYPDGWTGTAADSAKAHHAQLVETLSSGVAACRTLQSAFHAAEGQVEAIEREISDLISDASAEGFTINDEGTVFDVRSLLPFPIPSPDDVAERRRIQERLAARVSSVLTLANLVDQGLIEGVPALEDASNDGEASPEVAERWAELTDAEKEAVLREMSKELGKQYGIDPPPELVFEDLEDQDGDGKDDDPNGNLYGYWDGTKMHLDINDLDGSHSIDTLAHELRHVAQGRMTDELATMPFWQRALIDSGVIPDPFERYGSSIHEVEQMAENNKDYQDAGKDGFPRYQHQSVESDARENGSRYLDNLTPEELERLLKASR